MMDW